MKLAIRKGEILISLTKELKKDKIAQLNEKFSKTKASALADYSGMNVKEMETLRAGFRKASVDYQVIKNTFAIRAAQGTSFEAISKKFTGPVSIAFSYDDVVAPAKIISEFNKKNNNKLKVIGGLIEGKEVTPDEIKKIAALPSKEILIGRMMASMQSPLRGFIGTLNGVIGNFAGVLRAIKEKKEKVNE